MIIQPLTQSPQSQVVLFPRPDDREYWTVYNGHPVKLHWSEMTRTQRILQIESEQRAQYIAAFDIY